MKQARMWTAWVAAAVLMAALAGCGKKGNTDVVVTPPAPPAPGAPTVIAQTPPAPGAQAVVPDTAKTPESTPAPNGQAPAQPAKPANAPAPKPAGSGSSEPSWYDKDSSSTSSASNSSSSGSGSSGSGSASGDGGKPSASVGMPTIGDSDGFKRAVSKLKGKVVVVNFWATWCPPCVAEFPSLVQTKNKLAGKGVSLITVSGDETGDAGKAKAFLNKHGASSNGYLLTAGDSSAFATAIGWSGSFPATLIYDRSGELVETLEGEQTDAAFESAIAKHL